MSKSNLTGGGHMALVLTRELLQKLAPRPANAAKAKIWDGYVAALASQEAHRLFAKFEITTKQRLAHLLAQWCHECSGFTLIWESGAYSAKRIVQIFGVGRHSAKVTTAEASRLAYNGPALFERVYGLGNERKAKELGNTQKGDGWRFRGCGIVQLTGRGAHEQYAEEIGCAIGDLEKPLNAIHGALLEWREKKCNTAADKDDIVAVTKKVNGGRNGLAERQMYLAKAKRLLSGLEVVADPIVIPAADGAEVPEDPGTVKTPVAAIANVSRKASALRRFGLALHGVWMSLGLGSVMEWLGYAQSILDQVTQFISDHAAAIAITGAIIGVLVIKYVLGLMAEDVDTGRYTPSGEAA
jgi:predicted chitinase